MYVTDYLDNCKEKINAYFAQMEAEIGYDSVRAYCAYRWGFSDVKDSSPKTGNITLMKKVSSDEMDTAIAKLEPVVDSFVDEYGNGFLADELMLVYELVPGNPHIEVGGSFDGSDKGSQGRSSGVLYHLENLGTEKAQNLRESVLNEATAEALDFFGNDLDYDPMRVIDATKLSEKMWQNIRHYSIGASVISSITGSNPFENNQGLWHKMLDHPVLVETDDTSHKKLIFAWGHMAESYTRMLVEADSQFEGCEVIVEPMIFSNEDYPFLTCNLDAMLKWPDGHYSILEFKAPNSRIKSHFEDGGVPSNYMEQIQDQMFLCNIDDAYLVAMFDRETYTVSHVQRDLDMQMDLIRESRDFWITNVMGEREPVANGSGREIIDTCRRYGGKGDKGLPAMQLDPLTFADILNAADEYCTQKKELDKQSDALKEQYTNTIAPVLAQMGRTTLAVCDDVQNGYSYEIKYTETADTPKLVKATIEKIRRDDPTLYASLSPYITYSGGGRRLKFKKTKKI